MLRLFLLLALALPGAASAATIEELKSMLEQTTTARARFAQMVLDRNMKKLQQATGTMQFARPGKFRWEYDKPYEQVIVSDGARPGARSSPVQYSGRAGGRLSPCARSSASPLAIAAS